jgi:hypothetical protein
MGNDTVAVGTISDQDVEHFVNKIQSYIENDNKEQLFEKLIYAIKVSLHSHQAKKIL